MKYTVVFIFLCMFFIVSLSACSTDTPLAVTPTVRLVTVTPEIQTQVPLMENTQIPTVLTSTPLAQTAVPLVFIPLEATSAPPIMITQATLENANSPEPTIEESGFSDALIQIIQPGTYSQLVSPLRIQASTFPGAGNLVSVQLYGENGRNIYDRLLKMVKTDSGWVNLVDNIKFEIASAGESALLVVFTQDEFGRKIAQSASQIFLIQIGKSDVVPNEFVKEPFVVQSPEADAVIEGGTLYVQGYAHPFNNNSIIIELITETGGILEKKSVKLPTVAEGQNYSMFITDIPYSVDVPTRVRLTIRQVSELLPGIDIALSSQLITLEP